MDELRKKELLTLLVEELLQERSEEAPANATSNMHGLWDMFRALVNTRPPWPASSAFLNKQDELLQGMLAEAGIHAIDSATASPAHEQLALWRGDITTLAADAIVNAANSQMLGCWVPGHYCIDNAIHTFAGVQLRIECAHIMEAQGHEEPTGQAKITPAYNLPSKYVLHTVGPIANGNPTALHSTQLKSCYTNCLDLAAENNLHSVAFCCISTGVFGFPQEKAAPLAIEAVQRWLSQNKAAAMQVIFNVFSEADETTYKQLLGL